MNDQPEPLKYEIDYGEPAPKRETNYEVGPQGVMRLKDPLRLDKGTPNLRAEQERIDAMRGTIAWCWLAPLAMVGMAALWLGINLALAYFRAPFIIKPGWAGILFLAIAVRGVWSLLYLFYAGLRVGFAPFRTDIILFAVVALPIYTAGVLGFHFGVQRLW